MNFEGDWLSGLKQPGNYGETVVWVILCHSLRKFESCITFI